MFAKQLFWLALGLALGGGAAAEGAQTRTAVASDAPTVAAADADAKAREYFTDLELVTQDGEPVRFYTDVLRNRVVLINFIFTNCQDACPMMTRMLTQVETLLGEDRSKVEFVSISIDPERDSPAAMKEFAKKHGADHEGWVFLTGEPDRVNYIVKKLGQYTDEVEAHSTLMLAANVKEQHWKKVPPMVPPPGIAAILREMVEPQAAVQ